MKYIIFLFLLFEFPIFYSKTIQANDLSSAINEASPGDIIELESGTYSSIPYNLTSGTEGYPIIIKPLEGASVKFTGTKENCIFEFQKISYISIKGPIELDNSLCGIKAMDVSNIEISGLKIHNMEKQGIIISGENNEISNNEIYDCVKENEITSKIIASGWSQSVFVIGKNKNSYFSKNIILKRNNITNNFGEGLYIQKCDGCFSISNNISNSFSMNIYIQESKNIIIDGNILRINSDKFDFDLLNTCGIGLSSGTDNKSILDNITIKNNIIISTKIGIYFFQIGFSGYNKIKILHNTLWNISIASLWFEKPINTPTDCELRNNFIYIEDWIANFLPKKSWTIESNFYYNFPTIPKEYSDTGKKSKSIQNLDLNKIFNNRKNNCNYTDRNLNVECLRPSTIPDESFNLFHSGSNIRNEEDTDFYGCKREIKNPTIGAFEYYIKCTENYEIEDLKIKFRINYCISNNNEFVQIIGDAWNWEIDNSFIFFNEGNCYWSYTFSNEIYENFEYKFVISDGNKIYRWENDPNRNFNLNEFGNLIISSSSGNYEGCSYNKEDNLVTLLCYWK